MHLALRVGDAVNLRLSRSAALGRCRADSPCCFSSEAADRCRVDQRDRGLGDPTSRSVSASSPSIKASALATMLRKPMQCMGLRSGHPSGTSHTMPWRPTFQSIPQFDPNRPVISQFVSATRGNIADVGSAVIPCMNIM